MLKVSCFVLESSQIISNTEISYVLDFEDFENENEEKKELDESKKINQPISNTCFFDSTNTRKNYEDLSKNYRNLHFEFTTPPPELS